MNMIKKITKYAPLFLITAIMLISLSCASNPPTNKIDFSETEPIKIVTLKENPEAPFRVAIAGVISPTETLTSYYELVSYIGKSLHQKTEIVQRGTYAEINNLIELGAVDLAFVCTLAYVKGHEKFGMELLVVPEVNGETVYRSYIIVPQNSDAELVEDLKDRSFAFTDPLSNSGRLSPTYMLHEMGETPASFFSKYIFTYSHDNSIQAVADNIVDGAAVDSLVYDSLVYRNPEIGSMTKIIRKSVPYGIPPIVLPPAVDNEVKSHLRSLLLNLDQNETGKAILEKLMIDRFVMATDASYDSIREMVQKLGW
jgi:phosphonate transport system substrate-binding protein